MLACLESTRFCLERTRSCIVRSACLQAGQAALAQLADKLSSVQTQLDEKANGMDGSLPVKQVRGVATQSSQGSYKKGQGLPNRI